MNRRNMMLISTVSAVAALAGLTAMNERARKKTTRAGKRMLDRMSNIYDDLK